MRKRLAEVFGLGLVIFGCALVLAYLSYFPSDASPLKSAPGPTRNLLGPIGAAFSDVGLQTLGLAYLQLIGVVIAWGWRLFAHRGVARLSLRLTVLPAALILGAVAAGSLPGLHIGSLPAGPGGAIGRIVLDRFAALGPIVAGISVGSIGLTTSVLAAALTVWVLGFSPSEWRRLGANAAEQLMGAGRATVSAAKEMRETAMVGGDAPARAPLKNTLVGFLGTGLFGRRQPPAPSRGPVTAEDDGAALPAAIHLAPANPTVQAPTPKPAAPSAEPGSLSAGERTVVASSFEEDFERDMKAKKAAAKSGLFARLTRRKADVSPGTEMMPPRPKLLPAPSRPAASATPQGTAPGRTVGEGRQTTLDLDPVSYRLPPVDMLAMAPPASGPVDMTALQHSAAQLQTVLQDFGVRGDIVDIRPGPVVTLYELEPAPGTKSARVIGLADDIARSMSAVAVRIAIVPGRSVIGIELPNPKRETVYMRDLLTTDAYERTAAKLTLILGKDIGGQPVVADLARMPHLLIAGTTGSGKSVGINTMILSLLYRLPPEDCRFVMIDPKMLELSVYDGIPHLLTPVVTEPKKAVVALKWAVREMESRYRAMAKLGVRNIEGYNTRVAEITRNGEQTTRKVQTGFDEMTGQPLFEDQPLKLDRFPYIVIVVDEMADLMLVAGKDIEAVIQRLAQMARAAGIHLIMATQRPSVDVITGTIKANFPTRISFQVTSKIDSRTILGEGGAEQLLGQGDMLYMAGGGRITRVHGPFVSDREVEQVVAHLKAQGQPDYIDAVTEEEEDPVSSVAGGAIDGDGSADDLYDQAVAVVLRERKASTSFVQRHLQIGYNRAARLIDRMEKEGVVSAANHVGKREILLGRPE